MTATPPPVTIFAQRQIEARMIKAIFDELRTRMDEPAARDVIETVTSRMAADHGAALAAEDRANGLTPSLHNFNRHHEKWKAGDALDTTEAVEGEMTLSYNVTRCAYAEIYEKMGLRDIGDLISCSRDGALIEGYLPEAELIRTQTIMKGASHCDFHFRLKSQDGD
ncbi:MAG: 2-amino-thiazoline-4-carboxylic acid hydrolase [Rhodobacteraceae bacterium]|nr:2-amino-thiazoline-4-carboxylic acid hydrolase [Paracoccaceae bacterium]